MCSLRCNSNIGTIAEPGTVELGKSSAHSSLRLSLRNGSGIRSDCTTSLAKWLKEPTVIAQVLME